MIISASIKFFQFHYLIELNHSFLLSFLFLCNLQLSVCLEVTSSHHHHPTFSTSNLHHCHTVTPDCRHHCQSQSPATITKHTAINSPPTLTNHHRVTIVTTAEPNLVASLPLMFTISSISNKDEQSYANILHIMTIHFCNFPSPALLPPQLPPSSKSFSSLQIKPNSVFASPIFLAFNDPKILLHHWNIHQFWVALIMCVRVDIICFY